MQEITRLKVLHHNTISIVILKPYPRHTATSKDKIVTHALHNCIYAGLIERSSKRALQHLGYLVKKRVSDGKPRAHNWRWRTRINGWLQYLSAGPEQIKVGVFICGSPANRPGKRKYLVDMLALSIPWLKLFRRLLYGA
ncbi:hypothetical protein [Acetobacter lovaniensis]|uniref:hypothetical protein n=1 Tax=Acetobacter lovaniensis TaxID=104100 RepID=UPI0038CFB2FB